MTEAPERKGGTAPSGVGAVPFTLTIVASPGVVTAGVIAGVGFLLAFAIDQVG